MVYRRIVLTEDQLLPKGIERAASSGVRHIDSAPQDSGTKFYSLSNRDFPLRIHMGEHMDRRVRRHHVQLQMLRHLEIVLTGEWNNIPLNLIRHYIHSMRNRCIPVINAFDGQHSMKGLSQYINKYC